MPVMNYDYDITRFDETSDNLILKVYIPRLSGMAFKIYIKHTIMRSGESYMNLRLFYDSVNGKNVLFVHFEIFGFKNPYSDGIILCLAECINKIERQERVLINEIAFKDGHLHDNTTILATIDKLKYENKNIIINLHPVQYNGYDYIGVVLS